MIDLWTNNTPFTMEQHNFRLYQIDNEISNNIPLNGYKGHTTYKQSSLELELDTSTGLYHKEVEIPLDYKCDTVLISGIGGNVKYHQNNGFRDLFERYVNAEKETRLPSNVDSFKTTWMTKIKKGKDDRYVVEVEGYYRDNKKLPPVTGSGIPTWRELKTTINYTSENIGSTSATGAIAQSVVYNINDSKDYMSFGAYNFITSTTATNKAHNLYVAFPHLENNELGTTTLFFDIWCNKNVPIRVELDVFEF